MVRWEAALVGDLGDYGEECGVLGVVDGLSVGKRNASKGDYLVLMLW